MKILPVCYFPPVHWYAALLAEKAVILEVCQHYRKQQLTSRTWIKVANRSLPLTIPVRRRGAKVAIRDKKISFDENWQLHHWRSLESAYRNSPYFEFYGEEIRESLMIQEDNLLNFVMRQTHLIRKLLGIETEILLSKQYLESESEQKDLRGDFPSGMNGLPKWFREIPYPQVFGEFQAGLSILDLLFNLGPESKVILLKSISKDDS